MTPPPPFGIYVHWPYCAAKCPYCDFNSHVARTLPDADVMARAYGRELAHMRTLSGDETVTSVFFGGGTPSLMDPGIVADVLSAISALWRVSEHPEITLEANPTSVETEKLASFRRAGVNRLSIGVQSLIENDLVRLGRLHSVRDALDAVAAARQHFDRVSFDMIYARMGQTPGQWADELARALALSPDHLSLYQLTIEPGTPFFDLQSAGKLTLPGEDSARAALEVSEALCAEHGLNAYEISNFARPGEECAHNLTYWRYHDYAGVGPGAHGRLTIEGAKTALALERQPDRWLRQVNANGHGLTARDALTPAQQCDEFVLMGLRLREGISRARLRRVTRCALDGSVLEELAGAGLVDVSRDGDRVAVTRAGRPVLNAIIAKLTGAAVSSD